jgi:hypothetical protein
MLVRTLPSVASTTTVVLHRPIPFADPGGPFGRTRVERLKEPPGPRTDGRNRGSYRQFWRLPIGAASRPPALPAGSIPP